MTLPPLVRIAAPVVAPDPPKPGFPLVAMLAPIAVAGILFAVTGSPFMLLMAAFGPVIALATLVDGRRQRRRARREASARFDVELTAARSSVEVARAAELARRRGFATLEPDWGAGERAPIVAVSRGEEASGIELTGVPPDGGPDELASLRDEAATLDGAPVLRETAGGLAVVGPPVVAAAVARTLALRVAARVPPTAASLVAPDDEAWARRLPHAIESGQGGAYRWRLADAEVAITWAVPAEPGARAVEAWAADATTRARAAVAADRLAAAATASGLRAPDRDLPGAVALATLLADEPAGPGLSAPLGVGAEGTVVLDLVGDGPHAVVAGTTGSGKSELLVSWVLGMASGRAPSQVSFVLVDFKGGAAFAPLAGLPHVVGTLSDLDERLARRAIESLRAEVLRRERTLAEAGARAIDELEPGRLARLVVVVDEFAALLAERGDLHALFADLAARGRSLGIHLILCTQRPAGVVRDAVLANIAVRIALRVADAGDSRGLLGDDAAARLPATPRGRAVVLDGTGERRLVQVALAAREDVEGIVAATPTAEVPRPWCDPLPSVIPWVDLPPVDDGLAFGLLDLPAEQRQPAAVLRARHGHALVLGAPGSGVSTALAAIGTAAGERARRLPDDPVRLWAVLAQPGLLDDGAVLLADDLDLVLARCDPDHALELGDLVARLLREAPRRGIRVIAGARRLGGPLHPLAVHFGSRLLLRLPSREEHVLAGGDGSAFDPRAAPGGGVWDGAVVQVALPFATPIRGVDVPPPVVVAVPERGELAVVAARPRDLAARWDPDRVRVRLLGAPDDGLAIDPGSVVTLGDPDAWQADWAELARARRDLPLVVHGCSAADLRALTRVREVPPPLGPDEVWLFEQGRVRRAVLDTSTPRRSRA